MRMFTPGKAGISGVFLLLPDLILNVVYPDDTIYLVRHIMLPYTGCLFVTSVLSQQ